MFSETLTLAVMRTLFPMVVVVTFDNGDRNADGFEIEEPCGERTSGDANI